MRLPLLIVTLCVTLYLVRAAPVHLRQTFQELNPETSTGYDVEDIWEEEEDFARHVPETVFVGDEAADGPELERRLNAVCGVDMRKGFRKHCEKNGRYFEWNGQSDKVDVKYHSGETGPDGMQCDHIVELQWLQKAMKSGPAKSKCEAWEAAAKKNPKWGDRLPADAQAFQRAIAGRKNAMWTAKKVNQKKGQLFNENISDKAHSTHPPALNRASADYISQTRHLGLDVLKDVNTALGGKVQLDADFAKHGEDHKAAQFAERVKMPENAIATALHASQEEHARRTSSPPPSRETSPYGLRTDYREATDSRIYLAHHSANNPTEKKARSAKDRIKKAVASAQDRFKGPRSSKRLHEKELEQKEERSAFKAAKEHIRQQASRLQRSVRSGAQSKGKSGCNSRKRSLCDSSRSAGQHPDKLQRSAHTARPAHQRYARPNRRLGSSSRSRQATRGPQQKSKRPVSVRRHSQLSRPRASRSVSRPRSRVGRSSAHLRSDSSKSTMSRASRTTTGRGSSQRARTVRSNDGQQARSPKQRAVRGKMPSQSKSAKSAK